MPASAIQALLPEPGREHSQDSCLPPPKDVGVPLLHAQAKMSIMYSEVCMLAQCPLHVNVRLQFQHADNFDLKLQHNEPHCTLPNSASYQ